MIRFARRSLLALGPLLLAGGLALFAGEQAEAIPLNLDGNAVAIEGYDPVAYFVDGEPRQGRADLTYRWKDGTWYFASEANRERFQAAPERYAPRYGGYCAWAVSRGYTASIDPHAWRIVDGRLYLNYSLSVKRQWERNIPDNISRANQNWPRLLKRG